MNDHSASFHSRISTADQGRYPFVQSQLRRCSDMCTPWSHRPLRLSAWSKSVCLQSRAGFTQSAITREVTGRSGRNFHQISVISSSIAQDVRDGVLDLSTVDKGP